MPAAEAGEGGAGEALLRFVEPAATALELLGVAVILLGIALATAKYASDLRGGRREGAYERYRANLGRGILLGLELLVGADIIATVTAPLTLESVGLLGLVVLIRTFLSFALETEIEGVWPWRRREFGREEARRSATG
jgi:uncharacterized membrane protein